jgi:hypothetical protein
VAITDTPGGYHYYNEKLCGRYKVKGHSVRIGLISERAPCTARHELSHVVFADLPKPVRRKITQLYKQAMASDDKGLIFNDEYYMFKFLHAGHPMQNESEFFAGAMHAYTQHRDELMKNINAQTTPKTVKDYALATIEVLGNIIPNPQKPVKE